MSLRTNYSLKTVGNTNPASTVRLEKVIDDIIARVGGSIVYFDKARKFIE